MDTVHAWLLVEPGRRFFSVGCDVIGQWFARVTVMDAVAARRLDWGEAEILTKPATHSLSARGSRAALAIKIIA